MPFGGTTSADDFATGTKSGRRRYDHRHRFRVQNQKSTLQNALETWLKKSDNKACVDFSLHMAVTNLHGENGEETLREMEEMVKFGITSFKLFMAYPNVLMINDELMFRVMQKAAKLNALCCIHAENGSAIDVVVAQMLAEGKTAPHFHALSRSPKAEAEATHRSIALADMAGAAVYIVHLSNEYALDDLKFMQKRGARAVAETCTQYLVLSIEDQMPQSGMKQNLSSHLRCARSAIKPRSGRHSTTARSPSSPLIVAPSASKTRRSSAATTSQKFRTAAPASRTVCRSSGISASTRAASRRKGSSNSGVHQSPQRSSAWAGRREASCQASMPTSCSGTRTRTTPSPPQRGAWPPSYNMFEGWTVKGNAAKVFSRGELVVDNTTQPGKFLGKTGRGRFVKREANAGGLA